MSYSLCSVLDPLYVTCLCLYGSEWISMDLIIERVYMICVMTCDDFEELVAAV